MEMTFPEFACHRTHVRYTLFQMVVNIKRRCCNAHRQLNEFTLDQFDRIRLAEFFSAGYA